MNIKCIPIICRQSFKYCSKVYPILAQVACTNNFFVSPYGHMVVKIVNAHVVLHEKLSIEMSHKIDELEIPDENC